MKHPQLLLENQLCHRLYLAANGVVRSYRPILQALSLTYPQYVVMMALWEEDGVSIKHIINKTSVDAGALTLILQKLADKALLEVVNGEQDKRQKFVKLTAAGHQLADKAAAVPEQIRCEFGEFSDHDFKQLVTLLDKFNQTFCQSDES
ncbi:MarR family winged helix-turn-helix transcriptional regulator [Pseudoalteromonas fenneropenaei]|uniref:MarR family winged helix-turn-helix transcriptional regulator n=1 Tax=Pseudoalteromonas fenneropenaei TaxID=1737459 RepID=A0ABV7CGJ9_9GAMM